MRTKFYLLGYLILLFFASCIDESDYQLDEVELSPSLALPLVYGELKVMDLLNDSELTNIQVYPDGLLYLAYEQELKSQGIEELFDVPSKSINRSFILPGGVLPPLAKDFRSDSISQKVDLGLAPEVLSEIALKAGQLSYATTLAPPNSQLNYEVQVSLPGFVSRTTNKPLNLTARGTGSVALGDYTMKLTDNQFDVKFVLIIKQNANPTTVAPGTSVNIQLNFASMDFQSLLGFFGSQTASLPEETIELGAFKNAFEGADVSLAQPSIKLTVTNEYGAPCKVDFKKLEARKAGATLAVQLNPSNPVTLNSPATIGSSAVTSVNITNVKELLDFTPNQFFYQADARINDGVTSGNNFLTDTSKMKVKMNIEIPFYGHASNILLKDTVDVDWSDVDNSQIESAALKLKLTNQLPLDGVVQFFLTDASYNIIGTLLSDSQTNLVKGSSVDATGELQSQGIYDGSVDLEKTKVDKIFEAKHIIIAASMSTSKDTSGNFPNVKFKADYTLAIQAGILAKLKLNVKL